MFVNRNFFPFRIFTGKMFKSRLSDTGAYIIKTTNKKMLDKCRISDYNNIIEHLFGRRNYELINAFKNTF